MQPNQTKPSQSQKYAARRELMRRKAKAELERRRGAKGEQPAAPRWDHKFGALTDGAAQTLTFGYSDEIAAGLNSGFGYLGNYQQALDDERNRMAENALMAPGYRFVGDIGGALGSGVGLAKSGLSLANKAKSIKGMMGYGTADGMIYGSAAGSGFSDGDWKDRAKSARDGAAIGGAVGLAAPAVLASGSSLARTAKDKIASYFRSPGKEATVRLSKAAGGQTPAEIDARLTKLGPDAMLADALGEEGQALSRSAANLSPSAREVLEQASTSRMAGQPDRLTDALLKSADLDQPYTLNELQKQVREQSAPAINNAYAKARSLGHDIDLDSFKGILQSDMGRKAFREGVSLARDRARAQGIGSDKISRLAVLDEVKKSFDAMAQPAVGSPPTNRQAIAAQFAKQLRNQIDESLPEYGGARALAQAAKQNQDAVRIGADTAKTKILADFRRQFDSLTPDQRNLAAQGYASGKIDQINNRRSTPGLVDAVFGPVRQQEALSTALGPKAELVRKQIAAERAFARLDRSLKGNSSTARQLAEMGITTTAGAGIGLSTGGDIQSAGTGALASLALRKGGGAMVRHMTAAKEAKIAEMLAGHLTSPSLPQDILKKTKRHPELRKAITRALSIQSGGEFGPKLAAAR